MIRFGFFHLAVQVSSSPDDREQRHKQRTNRDKDINRKQIDRDKDINREQIDRDKDINREQIETKT